MPVSGEGRVGGSGNGEGPEPWPVQGASAALLASVLVCYKPGCYTQAHIQASIQLNKGEGACHRLVE